MAGTVKRSITLDRDLDRELTERFGTGGRSRFLNAAARDALARERIVELLDEMDADAGKPADSVLSQVARLPQPE